MNQIRKIETKDERKRRNMWIFLFILAAVFIFYLSLKGSYKNTEYYRQTKNSYSSLEHDKGRWGEYCIYKALKPLKGHKKFLFNCYLPKSDGEMTEADVILLHESGIYVFESKNYSGWIFGDESQEYWVQVLPGVQKESVKSRFFNPIFQNKVHIKWLKIFLNNPVLPFYSYIVFSDSCTLKDIQLTAAYHQVLHVRNLLAKVRKKAAQKGRRILPEQIDELYQILYPLTQAGESVKQAHRENINQKRLESKISAPSPFHRSPGLTFPPPAKLSQICPRCGGRLVMRTASKGKWKGRQFLGCANYPACKYLKDISS
ncbi:topoisomerase [Clostridiaceae bacterium]|nr:topoisomerase [Clostridiaceae bacterium]